MTTSLWNDEQELPIQHLRIIDMTVMLPGPFLTRLLAQYGADVIKVENLPHGDPMRSVPDTSLFELLNQGKRSIGIDLTQEEGVALVRQLAGEADVFIENFREGVMEKYNLGYAELTEDNPDLLYVSLRGLSGNKAVHAAHDLNFIGASGVGEWHLESGTHYATQYGDMIGGALVPALKLMFHLANPARRGMHLVSHMDECFRSVFLPRAYDAFKAMSLPEDQRENFGIQRSICGEYPHSRFYVCRDKQWVSLNAIQSKHWETFCEVVDKVNWKDRMWDKTLIPEVEKLFLSAPSNYWEALSGEREACLFRVVPWEEHLSFSQAQSQLASDPMTWGGFAGRPNLRDAPALGFDTFSVLNSMGISHKQISDWHQSGVLSRSETSSS